MLKKYLVFFVAIGCAVTQVAIAQDGHSKSSEYQRFDLRDAAFVEIEHRDSPVLLIDSDSIDPEKRIRTVPVQRIVEETRTRTMVRNGKQIQVPFTVKVPVTDIVTQEFTMKLKEGDKRARVDFEKVRAWEVSGDEIDASVLLKRLDGKKAVILLRKAWTETERPAINPVHQAILRKGMIFLFVPELKWIQ